MRDHWHEGVASQKFAVVFIIDLLGAMFIAGYRYHEGIDGLTD
jgi:hypothetical protein